MRGLEKRSRIFLKFARNLKDSLDFYGMKIGIEEGGMYYAITNNVYICPLCRRCYLFDAIDSLDEKGAELTLEHNPPRNLGGVASVLTCRRCNNTFGTKSDKAIGNSLVTADFINGKVGAKLPVRYTMGGYQFIGDLQLNNFGEKQIIFSSNTNTYGYKKIFKDKNGPSIRTIKFDFKIPEQTVLRMSYLKIAHLQCFKYFGYSYLLNYSGQKMIEILNGGNEYPILDCCIWEYDFSKSQEGISIITKPEELSSLLVVIKVKIPYKEKYVGVIMPGPDKFESLYNFKKHTNSEVQFKFEKYEFNSFPLGARAFYRIFAKSFNASTIGN